MRWLGILPEQLPVYFIRLMEEQKLKKDKLDMKLRMLSMKHEQECPEHLHEFLVKNQAPEEEISSYRDATPVRSSSMEDEFSPSFKKQRTFNSISLAKQSTYKRVKTPVQQS